MRHGLLEPRPRGLRSLILLAALGLLGGLGGCTSIMGPTPAPSCDGASRRPLNRSMWDWDTAQAAQPAPSPMDAPQGAPAEPSPPAGARPGFAPDRRRGDAPAPSPAAALRRPAALVLAASQRPCAGESLHG